MPDVVLLSTGSSAIPRIVAIKPYSIAVAPRSSAAKIFTRFAIVDTDCAPFAAIRQLAIDEAKPAAVERSVKASVQIVGIWPCHWRTISRAAEETVNQRKLDAEG